MNKMCAVKRALACKNRKRPYGATTENRNLCNALHLQHFFISPFPQGI